MIFLCCTEISIVVILQHKEKAVGHRGKSPTASVQSPQNRRSNMQTLPVAEKNVKAFYATVYDMPARLVKVDGVIYVVTDDDVEPKVSQRC